MSIKKILPAFGLPVNDTEIIPFGVGLINYTWLIKTSQGNFILQLINNTVFRKPQFIAENIRMLADYLAETHPSYLFTSPRRTLQGEEMTYFEGEGYFRLFPFIKDSHTANVVTSPSLAYEAAKQFGKFTRLLSGFPAEKLNITLPDFHNLPLRYAQFQAAALNGNRERIHETTQLIGFLKEQHATVEKSIRINADPAFKTRVTHHDTKISNVLFDDQNKGLCVIDLDTVMPGYFISDVGDMMRTCLSPVSEEEKDFSLIEIRDEYFHAIVNGYLDEMRDELTVIEKKHFVYAGQFMIYMQALRFLTDYLNNDVYYGADYEDHNLVRAGNQVVLLKRMTEKELLLF